ncbi:hypothetical protein [uncultured Bacteroides sp.]|jgi:hypothetical protein|uniref:hypothetical protein n=1 Tax=uncultured Bacteroides sp. TaxID=162156 RepID=UPI0027DCECA6|nr:hypothetical protein [uncultured Bacteroides sp.]
MTNASKRLLYINDSPHHPEAFCGRVRCKFIKNKFGVDKNDSYSLKDMRFWLFLPFIGQICLAMSKWWIKWKTVDIEPESGFK